MNNTKKRVVITGIGPISSLGIGNDETWENAIKANTGLVQERFPDTGEIIDKYFLHKIKNFDIKNFGLDPLILESIANWRKSQIEGDLSLFLATIQLALSDSELKYDLENNDIGLILTAESPGHGELFARLIDYFHLSLNEERDPNWRNKSKKSVYKDIFEKFKFTCYDLQTFMNLFHVGKVFNLHGHCLYINNACSSGLYALESAADLIRSEKCPAVLISAVDCPNVFKSLWFKEINIYPPDGRIKPFSEKADGFVLGEGGAAIVLEELNFARKRGCKIYAEYVGGAFNSESWKVVSPAVGKNFYKDVTRKALSQAKVDIANIDAVIPHGVGTKIIDRYEYEALDSIFVRNGGKPMISAFKPYVGHCLGGANLLEVALLLMCLRKNLLLPILNSENNSTNGSLNFVRKLTEAPLNCVLKTCTSFAGFNASTIFRKII